MAPVAAARDPVRGPGPFGLNLAAAYKDLSFEEGDTPSEAGLHILKSVPDPSADFAFYAVVAFPDVGLCEIRAISENSKNDSLGGTTMGKVDEIAEALEAKYGKAEKTNACAGGDVFCDPSNWTYALGSGNRAYAYDWAKPGAPNIRHIRLGAIGPSIIETAYRLDYAVNEQKKCEAAAKRSKAAKL